MFWSGCLVSVFLSPHSQCSPCFGPYAVNVAHVLVSTQSVLSMFWSPHRPGIARVDCHPHRPGIAGVDCHPHRPGIASVDCHPHRPGIASVHCPHTQTGYSQCGLPSTQTVGRQCSQRVGVHADVSSQCFILLMLHLPSFPSGASDITQTQFRL